MDNIKFIKCVDIIPHPDNPRKDLGDLTELAESIKINGVMQNLVVIENPNANDKAPYMCVIGHRRLAAAKEAGENAVPCVIAQMDKQTQVATMLLENMQRESLTPLEEARGFQMMLDLGSTIDDLAEKTGFSKTTVKHRVELAKLNEKAVQKGLAQGATLFDFIKLEQITDKKRKEEALAAVGTSNFEYRVQRAIQDERVKVNLPEVLKAVKAFATKELKNYWENGWRREADYDCSGEKSPKVLNPKGKSDDVYGYYVSGFTVYVLKKERKAEKAPEVNAKRAAFKERCRQLKEINQTMYQTRIAFIRQLGVKDVNKDILNKELTRILFKRYWNNNAVLWDLLGTDTGKYDYISDEKFCELTDGVKPVLLLLYLVCGALDNENKRWHEEYSDSIVRYDKHKNDPLYPFLLKLGYQMSDVEKQIVDGTHPLY
jgi:ParB family chromosome partitioning protein